MVFMAKISTQASNALVILEKLGRMAYKKINVENRKPFDVSWKSLKTNGRINPIKIFFKEEKVQCFKLNLSESSAKLMLGTIDYIAYCIEQEEFESLRVESGHIYINIKYEDLNTLTFEIFLHKDKLQISILAEPVQGR